MPMVMRFPDRIAAGKVVTEPVSQIDIFSTIMDYLQVPSQYDPSDGKSLRRYIEQQSFNEFYDERTAIVELDNRLPVRNGNNEYEGSLGGIPNLMIRHRNFKLIVPRRASSNVIDMMYNLVRTHSTGRSTAFFLSVNVPLTFSPFFKTIAFQRRKSIPTRLRIYSEVKEIRLVWTS